ncbi:glycosyltransferase family 2 protein [Candidatus Woesearchaeota archaeon]|nr:glycosyltransferase family 2 protein [Candidatus Woesearchaeota archaeon]
MKLSIIIPVYNEVQTIKEIIEKVDALPLENVEKEIIVVDDCSRDGTREVLKKLGSKKIKILFHEKNKGKGGALKTGLKEITGDIVIFQDADLEYDIKDYPRLIKPIVEGKTDVVYGSRFLNKKPKLFGTGREFIPLHYIGNKFLTTLTNILYFAKISDMDTCYTIFRSKILKELKLDSDNFDITPEITAKILKKGIKIHEIPITYKGRDHSEGKKINWKDGISAAWALIKYRFKN